MMPSPCFDDARISIPGLAEGGEAAGGMVRTELCQGWYSDVCPSEVYDAAQSSHHEAGGGTQRVWLEGTSSLGDSNTCLLSSCFPDGSEGRKVWPERGPSERL